MSRGRDPFESFFGLPGGPFGPGGFGRPGDHGGFGDDGDRDQEDHAFGADDDIFDRFRFGGFGRSSPFNDMNDIFRGAETMLRHMDSIFRDMQTFGDDSGTFGRIVGPRDGREGAPQNEGPSGDPYWGHRRTARDEMLKVPDSDPSLPQLEDKDLDSRFSKGIMNLDDLLSPADDQKPNKVLPYDGRGGRRGNSFWSGSSSVTTFSGFGNGRSEQRTSRTNPDGSQSTTVTRRIGDREYNVTTTVDSNGEKEVQEELVNMDDSDKNRFDEDWHSTDRVAPQRSDFDRSDPQHDYVVVPNLDPQGPSIFSRIFGSWWK